MAPSSSIERTIKRKITRCFETYGMTETLTHIASRQINGNTAAFSPLPEVRLSTDQRGCLAIQVPYLLMKIITNDVVELNQDQHLN